MMADKEGFDLLDTKGVDRKIQHLFSDVLQEDGDGRLWASYRDCKGNIIDHEIWSISQLELSCKGILSFSTAHPLSARSLYISDSIANLISFVQSYTSRFCWDYAAFIATGAKLDRDLFIDVIQKFPLIKKYYAIYGHSLIGRIRDCKVQHWLKGDECYFKIDGEMVLANYKGRDFLFPIDKFSLRNHLRQLRIWQTLVTFKPKSNKSDNFYP